LYSIHRLYVQNCALLVAQARASLRHHGVACAIKDRPTALEIRAELAVKLLKLVMGLCMCLPLVASHLPKIIDHPRRSILAKSFVRLLLDLFPVHQGLLVCKFVASYQDLLALFLVEAIRLIRCSVRRL
jgi:hypothetical protein